VRDPSEQMIRGVMMVSVPEEVKSVFDKQRVISMATADKVGVPNVILVRMWWWDDDETVCVVDNYLNKTRRNLLENPRVSFVAWDREARKSFQIKCGWRWSRRAPSMRRGARRQRSARGLCRGGL
jgi:predicted pyridoxine 5'-phosphate oxidase superfamily flavin-nucleotide-binding protein